ncbi:MAG: iron-containing redox enzyme family protein [Actinomycetota bacterium]|nr:iron-containing redox enzyme family protein [Actinomycetota bacterium]
MPVLPEPRGPVSAMLLSELTDRAHPLPPAAVAEPPDVLADEDLQLALYVSYELHYRGFDGVDDRWEWEPSALALRGTLERMMEAALREAVGELPSSVDPADTDRVLRALSDGDDGPSVSIHLAREGTREQLLEFVVHRSAYQLKEADPHSWALPRLSGVPKAALVEVQADEYGGGRADRIHAELFGQSMAALGLDPSYGAYLDHIPGVTLATVNLMSLLGLQRRLRGAIVGHLALFEMTSSVPNRRYGDALRRLGYGESATAFFDEHVEADSVHENIAAVDLAGGLIRQQPELAGDLVFGARALAELDARWGRHLLERWQDGRCSLRSPLTEPALA